jgi:broad specificity phosphatase PhoE
MRCLTSTYHHTHASSHHHHHYIHALTFAHHAAHPPLRHTVSHTSSYTDRYIRMQQHTLSYTHTHTHNHPPIATHGALTRDVRALACGMSSAMSASQRGPHQSLGLCQPEPDPDITHNCNRLPVQVPRPLVVCWMGGRRCPEQFRPLT